MPPIIQHSPCPAPGMLRAFSSLTTVPDILSIADIFKHLPIFKPGAQSGTVSTWEEKSRDFIWMSNYLIYRPPAIRLPVPSRTTPNDADNDDDNDDNCSKSSTTTSMMTITTGWAAQLPLSLKFLATGAFMGDGGSTTPPPVTPAYPRNSIIPPTPRTGSSKSLTTWGVARAPGGAVELPRSKAPSRSSPVPFITPGAVLTDFAAARLHYCKRWASERRRGGETVAGALRRVSAGHLYI
jgi:hypothetical protein